MRNYLLLILCPTLLFANAGESDFISTYPKMKDVEFCGLQFKINVNVTVEQSLEDIPSLMLLGPTQTGYMQDYYINIQFYFSDTSNVSVLNSRNKFIASAYRSPTIISSQQYIRDGKLISYSVIRTSEYDGALVRGIKPILLYNYVISNVDKSGGIFLITTCVPDLASIKDYPIDDTSVIAVLTMDKSKVMRDYMRIITAAVLGTK